MIKDIRMSKGNYLNYSQSGCFVSKYSNKTVYYNTYKNKMESKATLEDRSKDKGKTEGKKISNTTTKEIATI